MKSASGEPGMVAPVINPNTQKAELDHKFQTSLSCITRPCLNSHRTPQKKSPNGKTVAI
jgi:hypothetical protein